MQVGAPTGGDSFRTPYAQVYAHCSGLSLSVPRNGPVVVRDLRCAEVARLGPADSQHIFTAIHGCRQTGANVELMHSETHACEMEGERRGDC